MRRPLVVIATLVLLSGSVPGSAQSLLPRLEEVEAAERQGDPGRARRLADGLAADLTGTGLDVARLMDRLAEAYDRLESPDRAIALARKALALYEQHGEQGLPVAALSHRLAQRIAEQAAGDPQPLLRRALDIRTRELGAGHARSLESATALAQDLLRRSRLDEAEQLLDTAHRAAQEAHGPDGAPIPSLLEQLGQLADLRSDYALARRHYERALELSDHHEGAISRQSGRLILRLARLDYMHGDNSNANERYTRALEVLSEAVGPEHPDVGLALLDRAAVIADMAAFERAMDDLTRAQHILEAKLPPGHPNLAALYHRFGETELRRDRLDAARPWLDKALAIREVALGPDHPNVAATLKKLAQLHRRQGHPELALPVLQRIRDIEAKTYGVEHHWYAGTLFSMALNQIDLGNHEAALASALESERIGRDQLRRSIRDMPERTGLMYAADRSEGAALKVALALATRQRSQDELRQVWDALIDARSFVLDELVYRRQALGQLDDESLAQVRQELAAASSELARVTTERPAPGDRRLRDARARQERAELRLAEVDEAFANPARADRVTLAAVEAALPEGSALVSYALYESYFTLKFEYLALTRTPSGRLRCVELGDAREIDDLVAQWRAEARGPALERDPRAAESRYREVAATLRRRIWDPVADACREARLALIVPDGQLALVNLAALPDDESGYLVENPLALHVVDAERDAVGHGTGALRDGGFLAIGAPAFDAPLAQLASTGGHVQADVTRHADQGMAVAFRGARSGCESFRSTRFEALPGSQSELMSVAASWKTGPVTTLLGADATEAAFKALAPGSRVVHLATHGFFLQPDCALPAQSQPGRRGLGGMGPTADAPRDVSPEENPLTLSGLALAGANTRHQAPRDMEDGIVTAEEVAALDLSSVEWAVLSACDTGVGDVHAGEGVLGLRRAFRAAGARTLILSLWSVDDLATRDWMVALYSARFADGASTSAAVQRAGRAQLASRRSRGESTHPFYWGGFVATGDWR